MRSKEVTSAALISPDIKVYEFTAGGVRELRDDWCSKGKDNVKEAAIKCLQEKLADVKPTPVSQEVEEELEEVYALYKAVCQHTVPHLRTHGFPERKRILITLSAQSKGSWKTENGTCDLCLGSDEISTSGERHCKLEPSLVS
jgi:hypothetical protein